MKKILIVDDDEHIVKALSILLKAQNRVVHTALDPVHGMATAIREKPDVILLDIMMPAGGGLKMAENLANQPFNIPIIFLTASKREDYRIRAESLNTVGYFEKPFDTNMLLQKVDKILAT